eukprot:364515-Chlamydomonas_euryale.AAC.7
MRGGAAWDPVCWCVVWARKVPKVGRRRSHPHPRGHRNDTHGATRMQRGWGRLSGRKVPKVGRCRPHPPTDVAITTQIAIRARSAPSKRPAARRRRSPTGRTCCARYRRARASPDEWTREPYARARCRRDASQSLWQKPGCVKRVRRTCASTDARQPSTSAAPCAPALLFLTA